MVVTYCFSAKKEWELHSPMYRLQDGERSDNSNGVLNATGGLFNDRIVNLPMVLFARCSEWILGDDDDRTSTVYISVCMRIRTFRAVKNAIRTQERSNDLSTPHR